MSSAVPSTEQENTTTTESDAMDMPSLSVVIPFFNEEGNVLPLLQEVQETLVAYNGDWEVIAVNDGSRDGTQKELELAQSTLGEHICVLSFTRNFGQTAAMQTGIEQARGEVIATMDGDRQNDPSNIPGMVEHLLAEDLDMVTGWRKHRKDAQIKRKLPSKIANWIIRRTTGVTVKDYGCSLKVYRSVIIKQIELMGEMHRFIPAWVASVTDPSRIGELAVNHRARELGQSKYGLSRTFRVVLDLIAVTFFMRYSRRPGHFFGSMGLCSGALGGLILTYLLGVKFIAGEDIGSRPLLFAGILLVMTGVQLLTTGVLAEVQTRSAPRNSYPLRNSPSANREWHEPKHR